MLEGGVVIAEPVDDEAAGDDQQLCVVESIEVIHPVSTLPLHAAVQPCILEAEPCYAPRLQPHAPQVIDPAAAPEGPGHHLRPYGAMARLGDKLEALDPDGAWLGASVVGERGHGRERELLVHYSGWNKRHDEWLAVGSGRLRAAGGQLGLESDFVRSPARDSGVQHKAACKAACGAADGGQQTTKKPHQQHNAFTPEEDDAIRKGVLKYGAGKWKEILADRELAVLKLKGRNSDAVRLRWSRTIAPEDAQESGAPQTLPEAGVRREADVQGKPGLQLWRSDKNVTGYVGVTFKDKKSAEPYSAKGPSVNGEGQYLGRFRTALEAATAFAQHVQGMSDEWLQSRQVQHAWLEQHPGAEEGIKKGQDSKTARRAEREPVQSGGREGVGHGGPTPTVRLLQSKSGAEYKGVLPTVTRAAGLDLHLSAKTNTGYEGVSMKKQSRNEHGNRQNKFYVTCKGTHLGCFPSAVEAAAAYAAHLQSEREPSSAAAPRAAAATKATARRSEHSAPAGTSATRKQPEAVSYPVAASLGTTGAMATGQLSYGGGGGKPMEGYGKLARMAGVAAAPEVRASLRGWLTQNKLEMYGESLDELGYDDLDYLLQLPRATLAEVADEVSMKPGHKRKFVDYATMHSSGPRHDLPPKMTLATCAGPVGSVVHEEGSFAIGDLVTAAYFKEMHKQLPAGTHDSHRGRHYSGRIVGFDRAHDSFTVLYDDGDTEQDVQRASLRLLE
jgi:hypothetical protein